MKDETFSSLLVCPDQTSKSGTFITITYNVLIINYFVNLINVLNILSIRNKHLFIWKIGDIYANLVILATPVRIIGHQVVCLGHLGGFVAF